MAKLFIEQSSLIGIADAIRSKTGLTGSLSIADMITAINNFDGSGGGGDVEEIINVLKTAIDASGAIYNGVGYKDNTRISVSSGYAERDLSGVDLTGYIAVSIGDVLRFKNMQIVTGDYCNVVYLYNSSKTGVGSINANVSTFKPVIDSGGNVTQITIPTIADTPDISFIRINAKAIDGTSVITKNQPID
jgi:hypothetical protein